MEDKVTGNEFLAGAPGEWEGDYRVWFRPADEPDIASATRAFITSELEGRAVLLKYNWVREGAEQHGVALISSTESGGLQMGWSDTFHFTDGVMHNVNVGQAAKVLGHYGPEEEPWGWRTEFQMSDANSLEIRAYNILPDGMEALATEAIYRRVTA